MGWETQGGRVNFTQEIPISEEMTPIPHAALKALEFRSIFFLTGRAYNSPPVQILMKKTLKILFPQSLLYPSHPLKAALFFSGSLEKSG